MGREAGIWGRVTTYSSVDFFTSPRTVQCGREHRRPARQRRCPKRTRVDFRTRADVRNQNTMDCQTKGRCAPSKRTHCFFSLAVLLDECQLMRLAPSCNWTGAVMTSMTPRFRLTAERMQRSSIGFGEPWNKGVRRLIDEYLCSPTSPHRVK